MACEWEQYKESTIEEMEEVYSKLVFDHATNPRNSGSMENADAFAKVIGPCGDTMQIWLKVNDGTITQATFTTDGCGNAIASCSMVTEMAKGRSIVEAQKINQQNILSALGGLPKEGEHCALLAADTLKEAIRDYLTMEREPWKRA
jgi:nitrogen fixation NifU-like protein